MNGNNELLKTLKQAGDCLDKYEESLGFIESNQAFTIINLPFRELNKLTPDLCCEYSILLTQFNFYIQQQINKERSKIFWLEEKIKKIIRSRLNQQKGYSYDERRMAAIAEDNVASQLEDHKIQIQLKLSRIEYLTDKIKNLADKLIELAKFKRRNNEQIPFTNN